MSGQRLWDKGANLDESIHRFTVGSDPVLDKEILEWDVLASTAHAIMLYEQNMLSEKDLNSLIPILKEAYTLSLSRTFEIPINLEDCHTALEVFLTEKCGDSGKRIHLGRSRNDQVLVAMRLYLKNILIKNLKDLINIVSLAHKRSLDTINIQMPGHTHFQQAMPMSVGMWFSAIRENCIELIEEGLNLFHLINKNPLGVASGFGTPLSINRERTTTLLQFNKTQKNPINTQNSRGRFETKVLRFIVDISSMIEKFSFDLILYSMQELNFVSLPDSFTTGSSIMPQKRNPDVLELLRANASILRAKQFEEELLISKLPSHYHRDFQYTKKPIIESNFIIKDLCSIFSSVLEQVKFNLDNLEKVKTPELYVTYEAFRLVKEGMPFREAYKETAKKLKNGEINIKSLENDFKIIADSLMKEGEQTDILIKSYLNDINNIEDNLKDLPNDLFNYKTKK